MNREMIPLAGVRWRLAYIWFPGSALIFLLLIAQTVGNVYADQVTRAFGWAFPNFLPTLALMISVFAANAFVPSNEDGVVVSRNFSRLTYALSIFYILVILVPLLAQPLIVVRADVEDVVLARLEFLELSNIFIGPLQGLVIASIGVLFFLKEDSAVANP